MYGLVNKAIEGLVTENFGVEKWEAIKARAKVDEDVFISSEAYPDEMTYSLVGAASEELGLPAEKVLHAFGEYWVMKTAKEGYGDLMGAAGKNFVDFLTNLPNFHTRVMLLYPNLVPPRFEVTDQSETSLHLHYHSDRPGLSAFVVGLIHGLAKNFGETVEVDQVQKKEEGADHDVFLIHLN